VPVFRKTKSIVLVDLTTMESYEIKFDISEGLMPIRDSSAIEEKMEIE
jgi:hypothetical protein